MQYKGVRDIAVPAVSVALPELFDNSNGEIRETAGRSRFEGAGRSVRSLGDRRRLLLGGVVLGGLYGVGGRVFSGLFVDGVVCGGGLVCSGVVVSGAVQL